MKTISQRGLDNNNNSLKRCTKCGDTQTLDQFYKQADAKDGHSPWCKTCRATTNRVWEASHPGRKQAARNDPLQSKVFDLSYRRYDWMNSAKCKGENICTFFLPANCTKIQLDKARAICKTCPVRKDCLTFAIENRIFAGIWGGTTSLQRRRMIKEAATSAG